MRASASYTILYEVARFLTAWGRPGWATRRHHCRDVCIPCSRLSGMGCRRSISFGGSSWRGTQPFWGPSRWSRPRLRCGPRASAASRAGCRRRSHSLTLVHRMFGPRCQGDCYRNQSKKRRIDSGPPGGICVQRTLEHHRPPPGDDGGVAVLKQGGTPLVQVLTPPVPVLTVDCPRTARCPSSVDASVCPEL